MGAGLQVFDASGNLVLDTEDLVFRVVGSTRVVGMHTGNSNIDGSSGTITDAGLLTGTPYCEAIWEGTANNGVPSSADPPPPNISFSGSDLNYSSLWGDWMLLYGVS